MTKTILTILLLFCLAGVQMADSLSIIPQPQSIQNLNGEFKFPSTITISSLSQFQKEAEVLASFLQKNGVKVRLIKTNGVISFIENKLTVVNKEQYSLTISPKRIVIGATNSTGAFYAVQTLRQLLPPEVVNNNANLRRTTVPCIKIKDYPRFSWRAFMLDESRHFKGKEVVKSLLDQMAALKMNVFHWHLTDDQGWRIEIKKYPKLTSIGSKRNDTQVGGYKSDRRSGKPHFGFYTQEEIKDIVHYAAQRHITIVPEIGMPGHASAAVAAYPELGTDKTPIEVPSVFGKHQATFNAADESVYKILSEILDEVIALFPSSVIHIGGDEVRFNQWKDSQEIKDLMKREGIKTLSDVQIYFTNRMSKIIADKGRRMMGWNEILGDDLHGYLKGGQTATKSLDKNAIIHFWKGSHSLATKAIRNGHDVVNSTHQMTYLDYSLKRITPEKAYNFDPIFKDLAPEYHSKVKGFGCQMWSEWIPEIEDLHRQVFPRLASYAEVGWTQKDRKDFADFSARMEKQRKRWDLQGITYAKVAGNSKPSVTANNFFNHPKITNWSPDILTTSFAPITIKVNDYIKASGKYELAFVYIKGTHALDIQSVTLYENGQKISEDKHAGFSGGELKNVTYSLSVDRYKASAKYQLKVVIKGNGGTNSYGDIKITNNW